MQRTISLSAIFLLAMLLTGCHTGQKKPENPMLTIVPMGKAVLAGKNVKFELVEKNTEGLKISWQIGDQAIARGASFEHVFEDPGIYRIAVYSDNGCGPELRSSMILRIHTPETMNIPQVVLDTDARNEADDQHYIAYALYSGLDVLAVNSIHNNDHGSEAINYGEIFYIFKLMHNSGVPWDSLPLDRVYHGAKEKLTPPTDGKWYNTKPIVTEASNAILAAARGANPENPVWIMPVGPCTNIASAILQARREGFDLKNRIRIYWLGGNENDYYYEYNGGNDPWSVYVTGQSGLPFTVLLADPTSLKLNIDKRVESGLYPGNELGEYLKTIIPVFQWKSTIPKSIHDVCVPAAIISDYNGLGWVKQTIPVQVNGPDQDYTWRHIEGPSNVRLIMDIDGKAMKNDLFNTLNGHPRELKGMTN